VKLWEKQLCAERRRLVAYRRRRKKWVGPAVRMLAEFAKRRRSLWKAIPEETPEPILPLEHEMFDAEDCVGHLLWACMRPYGWRGKEDQGHYSLEFNEEHWRVIDDFCKDVCRTWGEPSEVDFSEYRPIQGARIVAAGDRWLASFDSRLADAMAKTMKMVWMDDLGKWGGDVA
jgi:hypothetical protein